MRRFLPLLLICVVATSVSAFAGQSTGDIPVSIKKKESLLRKIKARRVSDEAYVIGFGDMLSVSIYDEGDMGVNANIRTEQTGKPTPIIVRSDGRISLKDIGEVEAVGLTLNQLADYLKGLYAEIYDDPVLVTSLLQSNSQRYTVIGEVKKPGSFRLDNAMDILQVVAEAGGFSQWADKDIIVVRRKLQKGDEALFDEHKLHFDYDDFVDGEDLERNIQIRSGDVIVVE